MLFKNFTELNETIDILVEQSKYTEALDLLDAGIDALPPGETEKYQFQAAWLFAMLYSNVKKYDECIEVIRNIVKKGYPFPLSFKRFEPLKDMQGYKELQDINNDLLDKEKAAQVFYIKCFFLKIMFQTKNTRCFWRYTDTAYAI